MQASKKGDYGTIVRGVLEEIQKLCLSQPPQILLTEHVIQLIMYLRHDIACSVWEQSLAFT